MALVRALPRPRESQLLHRPGHKAAAGRRPARGTRKFRVDGGTFEAMRHHARELGANGQRLSARLITDQVGGRIRTFHFTPSQRRLVS